MEDGLAFGIEGKETTEELLATLLNDDLPSVFTNEPCYSGGAAFFDNVQAADSTVEDSDESSLIQQECQKIGLVIPEAGLQMSKSEERSFKQVKRRVKSRLTAQANRQKRKKYSEGLEKRVEKTQALNTELTAQVFELTKQLLVVQKENLDLRDQLLKLSAASQPPLVDRSYVYPTTEQD